MLLYCDREVSQPRLSAGGNHHTDVCVSIKWMEADTRAMEQPVMRNDFDCLLL